MNNAVRNALRGEIELTREKFHRFLVTIPEEALRLPSKDPDWTNGEMLYLMSTSPRILKSFLKRYTSEHSRFHFVSKAITGPLLQKTNELMVRSRGRNVTRWSLAEEYDNTSALVLELLDQIADHDFERTLMLPEMDPLLYGNVTIESMFHYVKKHYYTYRGQINVNRSPSRN